MHGRIGALSKTRRWRPAAVGTALALTMTSFFAVSQAANATTGGVQAVALFQGTPPLSFRFITTPEGLGQVRLQMLTNPVPLTVSTARCGLPPTTVLIPANDHTVHMLLTNVPAGSCVTSRLTGKSVHVSGQFWY